MPTHWHHPQVIIDAIQDYLLQITEPNWILQIIGPEDYTYVRPENLPNGIGG